MKTAGDKEANFYLRVMEISIDVLDIFYHQNDQITIATEPYWVDPSDLMKSYKKIIKAWALDNEVQWSYPSLIDYWPLK